VVTSTLTNTPLEANNTSANSTIKIFSSSLQIYIKPLDRYPHSFFRKQLKMLVTPTSSDSHFRTSRDRYNFHHKTLISFHSYNFISLHNSNSDSFCFISFNLVYPLFLLNMNINTPKQGRGFALPSFVKGRGSEQMASRTTSQSQKSNRLPFLGRVPDHVSLAVNIDF
jgi:hypothetical protein